MENVAATKKTSSFWTMKRREESIGWLFILPEFIGIALLGVFPLLFTVYLSFNDWNLVGGVSSISSIGLDNYKALFEDDKFIKALTNNLVFTAVSVPVGMAIALVMSVAIHNYKVPRLIIQPIIENSFIHGFRKHKLGASIHLRGYRNENELHISISDNGQGMSEQELRTMRKRLLHHDEVSDTESAQGIGLMNIMRRLQLTYGCEARLFVNDNKDGSGVTFVMVIPLSSNEESKKIG